MSKTIVDPSPRIIIGVGASAGGLAALSELLNNFNPELDPYAIIVAQHLSPSHKSYLPDLLRPFCKDHLKVKPAEAGEKLQSGVVYVIAPGHDAITSKGSVNLVPSSSLHHPSIDLLFESIAREYEQNSVGIILSGSGSDGKKGLAAIHDAGGLTIAQLPKSAGYQGMPLEAIKSGKVHETVTIDRIPHVLESYFGAGVERPGPKEQPTGSMNKLFKLLENQFGTDFSAYKAETIYRRLEKRLLFLQLDGLESYLGYLQKVPGELDVLYRNFMIGVTKFFRDTEVFEKFERELGKLVRDKGPDDPIRIWVAACCSGEEAYSLAILLNEVLGADFERRDIKIFATDIDEEAVAFGRNASYPPTALENLPTALIEKYFIQKDGFFEVKKQIRSAVLFSRHDVTLNPPFAKQDLISCRNLLIYFNHELQEKVLQTFHYSLNKGGLLFLGTSETIGKLQDLFAPIDASSKIFVKNSTIRLRSKIGLMLKRPTQVSQDQTTEPTFEEVIKADLAQYLSSRFVVVNEKLDIIHLQGELYPMVGLRNGAAKLNLSKNIHKLLQPELRSVFTKCTREAQKVEGKYRLMALDEGDCFVRLIAWPFSGHGSGKLYTVCFEVVHRDKLPFFEQPRQISQELAHDYTTQERISELEHELEQTSDYLESLIEELESSNQEYQLVNEELQSTNEELQAMNEEFETSNEELQATNQEVVVAYNELKELHNKLEAKDQEVLKIKNQLQTIFDNSRQAYLLVDVNHQLLSYNQEAEKLAVKITGSNISHKSLFNFFPSQNLNFIKESFDQAMKGNEVAHDLHIMGKEAVWLHVKMAPIATNGKPDTILISLIDDTEAIVASNLYNQERQLLRSIIDHLPEMIYFENHEGKYQLVNQAFKEAAGFNNEEDFLDKTPVDLFGPEAESILNEDFEVMKSDTPKLRTEEKLFTKQGERYLLRSRVPVKDTEGNLLGLVGISKDITQRKTNEDKLKRSEELLRLSQQIAKVGSWEVVLEEGVDLLDLPVFCSDELYRIFGYQPGSVEVTLELFFRHVPENEHATVMTRLLHSLEEAIPYSFYHKVVRTDGKVIMLLQQAEVICNDTGKAIKLVGTSKDITIRKELEFELERNNEYLKRIISSVPGVVFRYRYDNDEFKLDFISDQCQEVLGYTIQEIQETKKFEDLVHINYQERLHQHRVEAYYNGQGYEFKYIVRAENGKFKWVLERGVLAKRENESSGEPYVFGLITDVTEVVEVEQQIRSATFQAEYNERNRIALELHDGVQQVLISALMHMRSVEDSLDRNSKTYTNFQTGRNYLNQSIEELRSVAHKLLPNSIEEFGLVTTIENLIQNLNEAGNDEGVTFLFKGEMDDRRINEEYEHNLFRICQEATNNILKYAKATTATIRLFIKSEHVVLIIEDDGVGFDPENINVKNNTFGLSSIKSRINMISGSFEVKSASGKGTTLLVEIPLVRRATE